MHYLLILVTAIMSAAVCHGQQTTAPTLGAPSPHNNTSCTAGDRFCPREQACVANGTVCCRGHEKRCPDGRCITKLHDVIKGCNHMCEEWWEVQCHDGSCRAYQRDCPLCLKNETRCLHGYCAKPWLGEKCCDYGLRKCRDGSCVDDWDKCYAPCLPVESSCSEWNVCSKDGDCTCGKGEFLCESSGYCAANPDNCRYYDWLDNVVRYGIPIVLMIFVTCLAAVCTTKRGRQDINKCQQLGPGGGGGGQGGGGRGGGGRGGGGRGGGGGQSIPMQSLPRTQSNTAAPSSARRHIASIQNVPCHYPVPDGMQAPPPMWAPPPSECALPSYDVNAPGSSQVLCSGLESDPLLPGWGQLAGDVLAGNNESAGATQDESASNTNPASNPNESYEGNDDKKEETENESACHCDNPNEADMNV